MLRPSFETLASQAPQDEVCYRPLILSLHENLGLAARFRLQPVDVMATLMPGRRIARCCIRLPRGLKADDCDERYWHCMNRFGKTLLVAALLGAGLMLSQCGGGSATVRYRVIATVEVDGQRVEGSTVMEAYFSHVEHSLIGAGGATKLYGEALILDLKGRGTVFILPVEHQKKTVLAQIYEFGIPLTFGVRRSIGVMVDEDFARLRQAKGRKPFSFALIDVPTRLPAFVAFRDEKMPNTIYEVDPQHIDSAFPGVRFISLDIEITDAPVTKVLKQRLPWLVSSTQLFDRDPPGKQRDYKDRPLGYKITNAHFFGGGSR
jgi:hypothetical protein